MASVVIDLQDGFANDTVTVSVDGRDVYQKEGVSTDLTISRADSVEVEVPEGAVNVEVVVPSRKLSKSITLQVSATVYVGISILNGAIDVRTAKEQFYYM